MRTGTILLLAILLQVSYTSANTEVAESQYWFNEVNNGSLPPVNERVPDTPLVVDHTLTGRTLGKQGGTLRTMVSRTKDVRQMVVYGYARLVVYDHDYQLKPDILLDYEVEEGRVFTLHLRPGHRWSDGFPFTSADFRYWWEHVANSEDLSPAGPPQFLRVDGELPTVTFPDEHTVVYAWSSPNPNFIPALAQARPPFIFRPRHYLEQFHNKFADPNRLVQEVLAHRVRSWNSLHNKLDNMYKFDNPELPTLQPWIATANDTDSRRIFVRNPYYHRIDKNGTQLPYIDKVEMSIVGGGLIPAKSNAGESDLQARGLDFNDVAILKKGEMDGGNYRVLLWSNGAASQMAIYPNLNYSDPVWQKVLRDVRFRRALSLSIDRRMINRALYFGLGIEAGMGVLSSSPFYAAENQSDWSMFDLSTANQLLDEIGLTKRRGDGIRLLPDGRPLRLLIETAGERQEVENALQIVADTWRDAGVELVMRPQDRDILRMHVYSGVCMAAVWFGWDNGIPTPETSPRYLAPRQQEFFAWPRWGQYFQTGGEAGVAPDEPEALRLLELSREWEHTFDEARRTQIWEEMLRIHSEQVYGIGIVSGTPQPVVVSKRLRNVPDKAIWSWQPGAHFGVHRPDEFYFDNGDS
ncbi:MAG: ABC transporter substrate-binding protein [Granulosicoccus sp.]|nr:ABC transporter substrate-binding protein [Granulosicoccus sp.]